MFTTELGKDLDDMTIKVPNSRRPKGIEEESDNKFEIEGNINNVEG